MHVSSESALHIRRQLVGWPPRLVVEFVTAAIGLTLGHIILPNLCMVPGVLPVATNPYVLFFCNEDGWV